MDEAEKTKIRNLIQYLHHERGISLTDIGKRVGKSSGYMSYLARALGIQPRDFEESRLKAIKEKRRKYERKPFDGTDQDKAYLLGLRHGDLSVSRPFGHAISVSTSTTHPAMAELFERLFSPSGHVYQYPRYKKDTQSYEWNVQTILDESFEFLLCDMKTCWDWVATKEATILSYLAGICDAEGSVDIHRNARVTAIVLCTYNTNVNLLEYIKERIQQLGYRPRGLYLDKRKGSRTSKYNIEHRKDYWHIGVLDFDQSQSLLRRLPLRHREKIARKELALSLKRGDYWKDVKPRVKALSRSILAERRRFVHDAEILYTQRHPKNA